MEKVFIFEEEAVARASLELLYHISGELASALDLDTVLERALKLSLESVGGISGSIIVLNDKGTPVSSAIAHSGQAYKHTTRQLRATLEKGLAGWVARNLKPVLVPDTSVDERWTKRRDDAPDRTGSKSAVGVPLLARDRLVGVMTLVHPTPYQFKAEHRDLVKAIADQAGIAVLNAHLYTESQRQARVMTALAESAVSITAAVGEEDVLQRILVQIQQALRVEAVTLALIDPQKDSLEIKAATGPAAQAVLGTKLKMGEGIVGWVTQEGKGAIIPRVEDAPHFNADIDRRTGFETRGIACAPIRSQGKVIGALEVFNPIEGSFDSDALLVLAGIGSLAGSVIQHNQLLESLQAAQQSFQELFEDSIDPIVITDWDGNIVEANRQAASAARSTKEELQTMTIYQLHDVDLDKVGEAHFSNLSNRETISYTSKLKTNSETTVPVQIYVRQIILEDIEYLQWILRDITERKRLDTLRDDLISMIYHDLRSPLANVIYSMDVLESMLPQNDSTYKSLIDVAVRSTERIQRLTSSLLDLKRLEAGQPIVNRKPTAVTDLFEQAMDAVRPFSESKEQKIRADLLHDLPNIFMDEDMIRRVVINLLENAIKYTPLGGKITVGGQQTHEGIQIWVQDTGPGIPPEKRDFIFDKFSRLHSEGNGLGLGLAFCRLAVEGHSGRVWVESEDGEGSCFTFTLPITET